MRRPPPPLNNVMGPSGFKKRAKKNGEMPASMDSILITRFGEGVAVGQTEEL